MALTSVTVEDFSTLLQVDAANIPAVFSSVSTGSARVRPVGPRKSNSTASPGFSLLMPHANFDASVAVSGDNFICGGWFFIDERTRVDDGAHGVDVQYLIQLPNQYAESGSYLAVTPSTGALITCVTDYINFVSQDYTQSIVGYGGYNKWFFALFAKVGNEERWYMKNQGGTLTQVQAQAGLTLSYGKLPTQFHLTNNTLRISNGHRWAGRAGNLFTASITSFSDIVIPAAWIDPPTTKNNWYCDQALTTAVATAYNSSYDGTSLAKAWSPAQLSDELQNSGVISTSIPWIYKADSSTVPFSIDARDLDVGVQNGSIIHNGDIVNIKFNGAEIRAHSFGLVTGSGVEGVQVVPSDTSLGVYNMSQLVTSFTLVGGNMWRVATPAFAGTGSYMWRDDKWLNYVRGTLIGSFTYSSSTSKFTRTSHGLINGDTVAFDSGDLVGGSTIGYLYHRNYYVINKTANDFQISTTLNGSAVTLLQSGSTNGYNTTIAALTTAFASATQESFGVTGDGNLYLYSYDGSNPNSNGGVYEFTQTTTGSGLNDGAASTYIRNMKFWKNCVMNNLGDGGQPFDSGGTDFGFYPIIWYPAGLKVHRNLTGSYGGKHCYGTAVDPIYPLGSRNVILNSVASQGAPATLCTSGQQTVGVFYSGTQAGDNINNQILFDTADYTVSSGLIGSTVGVKTSTQNGFMSHTDNVGAVYPYMPTGGAPGVIFRNFKSSGSVFDQTSFQKITQRAVYAYAQPPSYWGSGFVPPSPPGLTYVVADFVPTNALILSIL